MKIGSLLSVCVAGATVVATSASAQSASRAIAFNLEAQDLAQALTTVGRLTGREIMIAADAVAGKRAPRLVATLTADEAVRHLLAGSGLVADYRRDVIVVRVPRTGDAGTGNTSDVVVTGSRIRGANSPSPLKVVTARQIQNAGQTDLGEVARSLPQNFNGGQNPEIGVGPTGDNFNLDAASSLNLRGLGGDATLTLLNGHRLAYDGAAQAIDISSIPLAAVDRIEIVADGASALYGSDAVGGVANILLKRDFNGLDVMARIDVPTSGGGLEQRYGVTAGTVWRGGGLLATYSYNHSDPIDAGQRTITDNLAPTTTLVRGQRHHNALATLHEDLGSGLLFEVDAVYSNRSSSGVTPFSITGTVFDLGSAITSKSVSYSAAPRLSLDIGGGWQVAIQGLYARNESRYDTTYYSGGTPFLTVAGCACNRLNSLEGSAEGALFTMPGGEARLALGAGFRNARYHYTRLGDPDIDRVRNTQFAYGELSLPLVGASNAMPTVERLILSVAGRYERYKGFGGVVSPKLGLIYGVAPGIDIKASWGRSFKAPTLTQQFSPSFVTVANATDLGFTNYPAGATIGLVNGGNESLKPERARSWSAALDISPESWRGVRVTASYFDVDFKDRVQIPVQSLFGAIGNPIYDPFILSAPTVDQVDDAIAGASGGLDNVTGRPFDPTEVVALVDSRYRNVTRERASGVDGAISYTAKTGEGSLIDASLDATYLTSRRVLLPGVPSLQLAGTVFNPARFRARGGLAWSSRRLTLAGYLNHIGGIEDRRSANTIKVAGQTTVDLSLRYVLATAGWLQGTEVALSASNAFNDLPSAIGTGFAYATPYDSTNYSAVGRVVGFQLTRRF